MTGLRVDGGPQRGPGSGRTGDGSASADRRGDDRGAEGASLKEVVPGGRAFRVEDTRA